MGFSRQGHWSGLSFPSPGTRHYNQDIKQVKQVPPPQKFLCAIYKDIFFQDFDLGND